MLSFNHNVNRRSFLTRAAAAVGVGVPLAASRSAQAFASKPSAGPISISSGNGLRAVETAVKLMRTDVSPTDAVVAGVTHVEDDPNDMSVGLGGLPNEHGVVQLDASVMDGPMHKAGAVGALENVRNPAQVALKVLRTTDHVMIVGEGALDFARAHGFDEENLLTDRAREHWLHWKRNNNNNDDWLDTDQEVVVPKDANGLSFDERGIAHTWGTIHCSGLAASGDVGACTTTSGLSWKIPGRVGDSPIIGAGMFVQNEVGSAGATGRGESVIQSCGSFAVVQHMSRGMEPTEACLEVLKWIADHTRRPMLLNDKGQPNFNVALYALRKDGLYGSAVMHRGPQFAVCDDDGPRRETCAWLFG